MQNLTNAETKNVNGGNKFTDAVNATKRLVRPSR